MNMTQIDAEWSAYLLQNSQSNNNSSFHATTQPMHSTRTYVKPATSLSSTLHTNEKPVICMDELDPARLMEVIDDMDIPITAEPIPLPICEELYISTKTKVLFLNQEIDIHKIFWNIPIIEYWRPNEGVVKKQMKIVSKTREEYDEYCEKLKTIPYYVEHVIKQIDNPSARRIKFKDERKITVGLSKKDIMNCRGKVKNAFYNCFAVILRFKFEDVYREIHVKIFNTGKMEIPGILNNKLLDIVKLMILNIMQPNLDKPLEFMETDGDENVLINSNFNCGYYINRERLHEILRSEKYRIESAFDPCSYPGVKCKFYFNNDFDVDLEKQKGQVLLDDRKMKMSELFDSKKYTEVSFMIFRTGSCLIVGNCSERILKFVFVFIKQILAEEYPNIHVTNEEPVAKSKNTKLRKKTTMMTHEYYQSATRVMT